MYSEWGVHFFIIVCLKNRKDDFMKKIIATILVSLMLMSTAYAAGTFENISGEIGELNIDYNVRGRVSSYLYDGNTYDFYVNDEDFEKLNELFSDQNLTNSLKSFNEPFIANMSGYPNCGTYTIQEVYVNEENSRTIY